MSTSPFFSSAFPLPFVCRRSVSSGRVSGKYNYDVFKFDVKEDEIHFYSLFFNLITFSLTFVSGLWSISSTSYKIYN